jgi:hypothetical protein
MNKFLTAMFLLTGLYGPGAAQSPGDPRRPVTLTGCVQQTADPELFLLAVPGEIADPVRGIATGEPVPETAGAGPAPRSNPLANPPVATTDGSGLPPGRYATPTIQNRSFRLRGLDTSKLKLLVGQAIEVEGQIEMGGFPSGDAKATDEAPSPLGPYLDGRSFKQVTESCLGLIRSR